MASSVKLEGLDQFRQALRDLPEHLRDEASDIVQKTAAEAAEEVKNGYPGESFTRHSTGNLQRGVTRKAEYSRFGMSVTVRSRAKHAWIYENGTNPRQTRKGANRGRMPKAPDFRRMIPTVIRHRRHMVEKLKDLVRKAGFQVD